MPGAGLEPAWRLPPPRDFKSLVSSRFTTRADRYSSRASPWRGAVTSKPADASNVTERWLRWPRLTEYPGDEILEELRNPCSAGPA